MPQILVIDDEEPIRVALKRALTMDGYEVALAGDGEEGEKMFREDPADLIIADIIMPKKEGVELLNDLKKDFPDLKMIIMSGGARMATGDDLGFLLDVAKSEGALRVFTKPFDLGEMLSAVKDVLGKSTG